jgi:hypothetical protein
MAELNWEQPRRTRGGRPQPEPGPALAEIARQLRAHPNRAAVIMTFPEGKASSARSMVTNIRRGRYQAFRPPGTFDAVSRLDWEQDEDGNSVQVVKVYACFGDIIEEDGEV